MTTHNSPKKPKVSQDDPILILSSAPPYKPSYLVLEKGDDPPTEGSIHSKKSFHDTRLRAFIEEQYFNINGPPPQFWKASNSNWMRSQGIDPTWGSNRSSHGSHKPSHSSQKLCGSSENSEKKSRRTGGPPNDSPFNSGHSRFIAPHRRQVAKVRSALSEKGPMEWTVPIL